MKKVLCIAGTRPHILKHSVFVALATKYFKVKTVWTGQHWDYKLTGSFLKELDIPKPEYSLKIDDNSFGPRLGKMISGISKVILEFKPDYVVVYGDCDTTLAGALAGKQLGVKVVHIEAGLRSGDMGMPEEVNRVLVDQISAYCFATTTNAATNLAVDGVRGSVYVSGDIVKDLVGLFSDKMEDFSGLGDYYFATIHRAENTSNKAQLKGILTALSKLDKTVIFPIHPRTAKKCNEWGLGKLLKSGNLKVIAPVGYLDSLSYQKHAKKVITDSGTIQKEAYILGTPCVTIRKTTEYPETCYGNWNVLCEDVGWLKDFVALEPNRALYHGMFGDGAAVLKICEVLKNA